MTAADPSFSEQLTIVIAVDQSVAENIARSLSVEAADLRDDRSETKIHRDGSEVAIDIVATDLIGLRAAANTWFGLLETAEETVTILREEV